MNVLLALLLSLMSLSALSPERTVILYNSSASESEEIARYYSKKRKIPKENMIGLALPLEGTITIEQYNDLIRKPLQKELDRRELWNRSYSGFFNSARFDLIVSISGVPFRIKNSMVPGGYDAEGNALPPKPRGHQKADGASVDSELTMLGAHKYERVSAIKNPYFRQAKPFRVGDYKGTFLVGRIDGHSKHVCIKQIDDAISVEETGLYGKCYLDFAKKTGGFQLAEDWLQKIKEVNKPLGIPTLAEQTKYTYVPNYPMNEAALYYGWYARHANGFMRHPHFYFKRGAIAVHIHSFSATNIRSNKADWVGPIMAKGAAGTLGNVHEPFLGMTTHLDHFHQQLLDGRTLVESAWSATPVLSWHNVVIGDPLYRPFANAKPRDNDDEEYALLREMSPIKTKTQFRELQAIAKKKDSSRLYEAIALIQSELKAHEKCISFYKEAREEADVPMDRARSILNQVSYYMSQDNKKLALATLQANLWRFEKTPEHAALKAMQMIIDPPPPPEEGTQK